MELFCNYLFITDVVQDLMVCRAIFANATKACQSHGLKEKKEGLLHAPIMGTLSILVCFTTYERYAVESTYNNTIYSNISDITINNYATVQFCMSSMVK